MRSISLTGPKAWVRVLMVQVLRIWVSMVRGLVNAGADGTSVNDGDGDVLRVDDAAIDGASMSDAGFDGVYVDNALPHGTVSGTCTSTRTSNIKIKNASNHDFGPLLQLHCSYNHR